MPAPLTSLDLSQHPQLLPWLVSSSALGVLVAAKKLCTALKSALLAGLVGLAELQRGLCEFILKCDANWCELRKQLAEHRRVGALGPRTGG